MAKGRKQCVQIRSQDETEDGKKNIKIGIRWRKTKSTNKNKSIIRSREKKARKQEIKT